MPKRIVIISGATACGKSHLALEFSKKRDIAIINADSLQVYQGLPILSAQPSLEDQKKLPHFLYSHLKPEESFSVGSWLKLVKDIVEKVGLEDRLPVIVGGSGMYISKLVEGISEMPEVSEENRLEAQELYEKIGHAEFQEKFGAGKIIDKQRLLRAAEILIQTNKPISFWQANPKEKILPEAKFTHINLEPNRNKIYENCNLRFAKMLEEGALEEVEKLLELNPKTTWQVTKTIGFEEISLFIKNKISYEKMLEIGAQKTRNYAKRQMTWFRNQLPEKISFNDTDLALEFLRKL
jgi:tRNA dimethylallyltransferase